MNNEHSYEVSVKWSNQKRGSLFSPDLEESLEVATPPPFPGGVSGVWSPEHLFTAALSSCLMTTFLAIAENSKLEFTAFEVKSNGILEQIEGKYLMTRVQLFPVVTIPHQKDEERTKRILQKAEANCLISNSVKSKIEMVEKVIVLDTPDAG